MTQNEKGSAQARAEGNGASNSNNYIDATDDKVTDCVRIQRPTMFVRVIIPKKLIGPYGVISLEGRCPHCGKIHSHGGGTSLENLHGFFGHRVAHCTTPKSPDGYWLVPEDPSIKYDHDEE